MGKSRLEAFSDGVLAIIITIMVLELRVPHDASLDALRPLSGAFLSYVLSFIYRATPGLRSRWSSPNRAALPGCPGATLAPSHDECSGAMCTTGCGGR